MEASVLRCSACGATVGAEDLQCPYCRSQLATVACPSCFGLVSMRAEHCSHCGAAIRVQPEAATNHRCPECQIPLASSEVGQTQLEQCHRCGGVWLPLSLFENLAADREQRGEVLGALPGAYGKEEIREASIRYRPCPQCGTLMNRSNYGRISGVIVDSCKSHGLWFDRDELRRVLAFIEKGGLDRARERQIRELDEKQRLAALAPTAVPEWVESPDRRGPGLVDLVDAVSGLVARIRR